ncbi:MULTISPECIES: M91 family zinc metallopeptidase [Pseudomonas]|uniref:M91 family zinc metallopeptidase n=1 Tax=Pseudomonas TaxID=286 RepID=UPI001E2C45B8|nr:MULTISPECIES: M91 family zinc metallopeptidase [Pseudomonas]MCE1115761.1 M91 family zinc metallopeptidase [Pseudomonas sp. NMI795_08]
MAPKIAPFIPGNTEQHMSINQPATPLQRVSTGPSPKNLNDDHALPFQDQNLHLQALPGKLLARSQRQRIDLYARRDKDGAHLQTEDRSYFIALNDGDVLHIITNGGDDKVEINTEQERLVIIETGEGNDAVIGHASMGANILVNTAQGDDLIELDGEGLATLYAGDGNDRITTAMRRATVFTGTGDDHVRCHGESVVDATNGVNRVERTPHRDHVYANDQTQLIANNFDRVQASGPGPHPGFRSITINGTPEYQDLVRNNLALLLATSSGRAMLQGLDASNARIVIEDTPELDNGHFDFDRSQGDPSIRGSQPGDRVLAGKIGFNPLAQRPNTPAVIILYHELCHAWNHVNGTVMPEHENQVTGLWAASTFDFDGDPHTPANNTNPDPFNENALRRELGLPRRNIY